MPDKPRPSFWGDQRNRVCSWSDFAFPALSSRSQFLDTVSDDGQVHGQRQMMRPIIAVVEHINALCRLARWHNHGENARHL